MWPKHELDRALLVRCSIVRLESSVEYFNLIRKWNNRTIDIRRLKIRQSLESSCSSTKQNDNWFTRVKSHTIFTEPNVKGVQTWLKCRDDKSVAGRWHSQVELRVIRILLLMNLMWLVSCGNRWGVNEKEAAEPWGTPTVREVIGDECKPIRSDWVLSVRQEMNQECTLTATPKLYVRCLGRRVWSMVSNAALVSSDACPHQLCCNYYQRRAVELCPWNNQADRQIDIDWNLNS